jgi:hypothetical protein
VAARHIVGHFLPHVVAGALNQALPERVMAEASANVRGIQVAGKDRQGKPFMYIYTLTRDVRDARSADALTGARAGSRTGITHLLVRHDVLFDYARSPIVDDRQPREHNLAKLRLLLAFVQNGARLLRGDEKVWLIELPRDLNSPDVGPGRYGTRAERG